MNDHPSHDELIASLDRLHRDINGLRKEVSGMRESVLARVEGKADRVATHERLSRLEEAERRLYQLALKIAVGCGFAGSAAAKVFELLG